jgi:hypothetical protein
VRVSGNFNSTLVFSARLLKNYVRYILLARSSSAAALARAVHRPAVTRQLDGVISTVLAGANTRTGTSNHFERSRKFRKEIVTLLPQVGLLFPQVS